EHDPVPRAIGGRDSPYPPGIARDFELAFNSPHGIGRFPHTVDPAVSPASKRSTPPDRDRYFSGHNKDLPKPSSLWPIALPCLAISALPSRWDRLPASPAGGA